MSDNQLLETELDTRKHIERVQYYMGIMVDELLRRSRVHDKSKLGPEELPLFATVNSKLKTSTYGSKEYDQFLKELGPALEHHYRANSHHPEHYPNGLNGMDLCDLVEMFCDWMAATERHNNGDIHKSINHNRGRFGMEQQTCAFMANTATGLMKHAVNKE